MQDLSKAYSARKKKTSSKLPVPKVRKRIKQKGRRTIEYEHWRDTVAKPYLDKTFGHVCADCGEGDNGFHTLDVDHIDTRGGHAGKKMDLNNVQYLGRYPCHFNKTNHMGKYKES